MKTRLILCLLIVFGYQLNAQNTKVAKVRLGAQEKGIILIASYTAQGKLVNLGDALNEGLNNGLTINQIKEVLVHLYAYAGFPRSIRGLQTFLEVLEDRKSKGITDERGVDASPISETQDKYDRGKKILESLVGRSLDGPKPAYQEFSPEMDRFLKEHLFADIFERDVLSHKQRELVTISVIASLGTLEPMLKSHLNLSLNVGWQHEQLHQFTKVLEGTTTTENVKAAKIILKEVLDNRK
ncbi:carboxymuconolactone decarboxylase family protein [Maribacter polysiphoniae]|uniref:carboxymuconolactone decarboxylase family protein n=1 Tax=Maribacter polysiphoniae TaxID=429344 RepID=UPI002354FE22|nr:carboxymuconolactone decarboxylase family protein [Maribacter polysiphoniae]